MALPPRSLPATPGADATEIYQPDDEQQEPSSPFATAFWSRMNPGKRNSTMVERNPRTMTRSQSRTLQSRTPAESRQGPFMAWGWCGSGAMCFEVAKPQAMPVYLGNNKGSFTLETTYTYVGDGGGEYDVAEPPKPERCSARSCLCFCGCAVLGVVLAVPLYIFLVQAGTSRDGGVLGALAVFARSGERGSKTYDCVADYAHREERWSAGKKEWCCERFPPTCPFNCTGGPSTGSAGWSEEKKGWCCRRRKHGCPDNSSSPSETSAPGPFNCTVGNGTENSSSPSAWSAEKQAWCCPRGDRGCNGTGANSTRPTKRLRSERSVADPVSVTESPKATDSGVSTTAEPFDCQSGSEAWSLEEASWCCKHRSLGCLTTPAAKYNCTAGDAKDWPRAQQQWCCGNRTHGCPEDRDKPPFD